MNQKALPIRYQALVRGRVQGVGFRPFIYQSATKFNLSGYVKNTAEGVLLEVQGTPEKVDQFFLQLTDHLPPLAKITSLDKRKLNPVARDAIFSILPTEVSSLHHVLVGPDTAPCDDCRKEMENKADPRYLYSFANCTKCGPRFSIIKRMPYDRSSTAMACFPLCPSCGQEYANPNNRRFHTQPNACPVCGPELWYSTREQAEKSLQLNLPLKDFIHTVPNNLQAIEHVITRILHGDIIAIKGLGGFHLACSVFSEKAIRRLRERKNRPHKPLAVMVPDLATAKRIANISPTAQKWLVSPERPIVLCPKLPNTGLADNIAPDIPWIGIMLPATPLHHVLFILLQQRLNTNYSNSPLPLQFSQQTGKTQIQLTRTNPLAALIMTSGNASGEPICLHNREAIAKLSFVADGFLFHNRDIVCRVDDSVIKPLTDGGHILFRRARGFVPSPLPLPNSSKESMSILAFGADLKNTFCLTQGNNAFVSQHIGDMNYLETTRFQQEAQKQQKTLFTITPTIAIHDLHPDYTSTQLALQSGLPTKALQHHVAHAYAVIGEHKRTEATLVFTLDGTGFGGDASIWGGELFLIESSAVKCVRIGHCLPLLLPGGEKAITEPWRIAHAFAFSQGISAKPKYFPWEHKQKNILPTIETMVAKAINCPQSTGMGRLFDAVAAILGFTGSVTYEGQAAIYLEALQDPVSSLNTLDSAPYSCPTLLPDKYYPLLRIDTYSLLKDVISAWQNGKNPAVIAKNFHISLAQGLISAATASASQHGITHVAFSGGCMQNATLVTLLKQYAIAANLCPLFHYQLPPNDACISYGQAVWGTIQNTL